MEEASGGEGQPDISLSDMSSESDSIPCTPDPVATCGEVLGKFLKLKF